LFPLPDGAGIEVTAATVVSGRYEQPIDNYGVQADVIASQASADDLAAGRDPGIDAAVAALSDQQPFTVPPATDATLTPDALRATLGAYEVTTAEVPTAPEIQVVHYLGDYVLDRYNQW